MSKATRRKLTEREVGAAKRLRERFNVCKRESGLTQMQLAKRLGISQSSVSQYFNGVIPLNWPIIVGFCRELTCSPAEIAPWLAKKYGISSDMIPEKVASGVPRIPIDDAHRWPSDPNITQFDAVPVDAAFSETLSGMSFCVMLESDEMMPRLEPGTFLIIDPGFEAPSGWDVLVYSGKTGKCHIRQYVTTELAEDGREVIEYRPANPNHPRFRFGPKNPGRLIGVVRESRRRPAQKD